MYKATLKDVNENIIVQFLELEFENNDFPPYFVNTKIIIDINGHHVNDVDSYLLSDFVRSINEIEGLLYNGYKKMYFDNVLNPRFDFIIEKSGELFNIQIVIKDEEYEIIVSENIIIEFLQLNNFYLQLKAFRDFLYSLSIYTN